MNPTEHQIQVTLCDYLDTLKALFHSNPNEGKRSFANGKAMKARGMRKGVLDLFIVEARQNYHGFYLEVKSKGKKPTKEQYQFMEDVTKRGYYANWCDNIKDGLALIRVYFSVVE